jgi:hypothetical protein
LSDKPLPPTNWGFLNQVSGFTVLASARLSRRFATRLDQFCCSTALELIRRSHHADAKSGIGKSSIVLRVGESNTLLPAAPIGLWCNRHCRTGQVIRYATFTGTRPFDTGSPASPKPASFRRRNRTLIVGAGVQTLCVVPAKAAISAFRKSSTRYGGRTKSGLSDFVTKDVVEVG